ncbi:MAG: NAD(P)H-dependent oxidoreductase subunit E [Spirochaetaceae bacterium]|jgi:NADH-quinone oxidoreductase subunit E|nr:NAD(P)H-dependent oxidoreductase subunit E [Spirochaetaceae bacterium]
MIDGVRVCFSDELNSFIDEWEKKPGNLIMILHKVQEEQGYISEYAAREVSRRTGVPLAKIYGVISFYHFFKTVKPGKNRISVCLGTACYLKDGQDLYDETRSILGLKDGETTTADGKFSVESVRCVGCCGLAPVITVNGAVYGKLKRADIRGIINQFAQ